METGNYVITHAVDKVILVPPEPPTTMTTFPFSSTIIDGQVDERGRFPGPGAFAFGHGKPS